MPLTATGGKQKSPTLALNSLNFIIKKTDNYSSREPFYSTRNVKWNIFRSFQSYLKYLPSMSAFPSHNMLSRVNVMELKSPTTPHSVPLFPHTFGESMAMFRTGPSLWNREYWDMMKTPSLVWRTLRTLPWSVEIKKEKILQMSWEDGRPEIIPSTSFTSGSHTYRKKTSLGSYVRMCPFSFSLFWPLMCGPKCFINTWIWLGRLPLFR